LAGVASAWELAGHQSVGSEQLFSFASLVFLGFSFSLFVIFILYIIITIVIFQLLNCFYLNAQLFSLLPF